MTKQTDTTVPKAIGIGGIFFTSADLDKTKSWYSKHLGLEISDYGYTSFESKNINNPDQTETTTWTPFKQDTEYFAPSQKEFMINYRVQNIEELVKKLKAEGVTILDEVTNYDGIGKFVHIMDEEGRKIELWEPEKN